MLAEPSLLTLPSLLCTCLVCAPQVFITHLHSDHHADLASLYVGAMFGRRQPWEVWGPSGEEPQLGTAAAVEGLRQVRGELLATIAA